jgi:Flp pilus assembly pilin Flp
MGWVRRLRRSERGQDLVEYAGVLLIVAAVIAAVASLDLPSALARSVGCEIQRIEQNARTNGSDIAGSRPPGATGSGGAAASGATEGTIEQALGSNRLIDACAGGTAPNAIAEQTAPESSACKQQLAKLSPHALAIMAVLAATVHAQQPGNQGSFGVLLEGYLRDPGYAVIALSSRAQAEQRSGSALQQQLENSPGDPWDGLLGSLCGGYGICLGGNAMTQAYQQAWHASAQLNKITTPILLATGIGGAVKDLAGSGLKAILARLGGDEAKNVDAAVEELEGKAGTSRSSGSGAGVPSAVTPELPPGAVAAKGSMPELTGSIRASFEAGRYDEVTLPRGTVVYRAENGRQGAGSFLGFEKPTSRDAAESLYNIAKFGNRGEVVTTYEITQDTTVYYGQVTGGTGTQALLPRGVAPTSVLRQISKERLP